ncbi:MAG: hypothetical protein FJW32_18135 [Acidobacteria bacterium]|nr:hypothetical protein [Acidobacteriota bacterium]
MRDYEICIGPIETELLGCVVAAATFAKTVQPMPESIEFHLEGVRIHGDKPGYGDSPSFKS